jgi:hypothetical protein
MNRPLDFATILGMNPLFSGLGAEAIGSLARLCQRRRLPAGQTLFVKGDPGDALYGVRRGQIRIEIGTNAGERLTIEVFGAGDLFGEIAVLDWPPAHGGRRRARGRGAVRASARRLPQDSGTRRAACNPHNRTLVREVAFDQRAHRGNDVSAILGPARPPPRYACPRLRGRGADHPGRTRWTGWRHARKRPIASFRSGAQAAS